MTRLIIGLKASSTTMALASTVPIVRRERAPRPARPLSVRHGSALDELGQGHS